VIRLNSVLLSAPKEKLSMISLNPLRNQPTVREFSTTKKDYEKMSAERDLISVSFFLLLLDPVVKCILLRLEPQLE